MASHGVYVVLTKNGEQFQGFVVPPRVKVNKGQTLIIWQAVGPGAYFPEKDFFHWKTPPPSAVGTPTRDESGAFLTLQYDNIEAYSYQVWDYAVRIHNQSEAVLIDPEVDNGPPGGNYTIPTAATRQ